MTPIKTLYCRTFQLAFRLALPLLPYREPEPLCSITAIPPLLQDKQIHSVLLVTDHALRSLGVTAPLEQTLEQAGVH